MISLKNTMKFLLCITVILFSINVMAAVSPFASIEKELLSNNEKIDYANTVVCEGTITQLRDKALTILRNNQIKINDVNEDSAQTIIFGETFSRYLAPNTLSLGERIGILIKQMNDGECMVKVLSKRKASFNIVAKDWTNELLIAFSTASNSNPTNAANSSLGTNSIQGNNNGQQEEVLLLKNYDTPPSGEVPVVFDDAKIGYANGGYEFQISKEGRSYQSIDSFFFPSNFYTTSADIALVKGEGLGGIIFNFSEKDEKSAYIFVINPVKKQYAVINSQYKTVINFTQSDLINDFGNNRLKVLAQGNETILYINNQSINKINIEPVQSDLKTGFWVASTSENIPVCFRFNNLRITRVKTDSQHSQNLNSNTYNANNTNKSGTQRINEWADQYSNAAVSLYNFLDQTAKSNKDYAKKSEAAGWGMNFNKMDQIREMKLANLNLLLQQADQWEQQYPDAAKSLSEITGVPARRLMKYVDDKVTDDRMKNYDMRISIENHKLKHPNYDPLSQWVEDEHPWEYDGDKQVHPNP
jgi:hypothetical protein